MTPRPDPINNDRTWAGRFCALPTFPARRNRENKSIADRTRRGAGKYHGHHEINPLLLKLSIPMMISMLVQALYNVVDSVFVSHVSESALTAVSLAFSLQNVMMPWAWAPVWA